jgi:hypothetical protein
MLFHVSRVVRGMYDVQFGRSPTYGGQTPPAQRALVVAAVVKARHPPKFSHHARLACSRRPLGRPRAPRQLPQRPRVYSLDAGPSHLHLLQLVFLPPAGPKRPVPLPGLEQSSRRKDLFRPLRSWARPNRPEQKSNQGQRRNHCSSKSPLFYQPLDRTKNHRFQRACEWRALPCVL